MIRRVHVLAIFAIICGFGAAQAVAPIAPETIKQHVQSATYSSGYSQNTYAEVAQTVLTSNSLASLFKNYTITDIFGWNGGNYFFLEMVNKSTTPQEVNALINAIKDSLDVNTILYQCGYLSFEQLLAKGSEPQAQQLANLLYSTNQSDNILFQYIIPNLSNPTAKKRLYGYIKIHIQTKLTSISLDSILNETTPTAIHMLSDYITTTGVVQDITDTYSSYKAQIAQLFCSVIKDEKKLTSLGYSIFFHSQRWDYLFIEKLYTDLWALTNKKNRPTNYLFPHVRVKKYDPLAQGPLDRTTLLQQGRTDMHSRHALLFVNNSLFGKYKNDPHSSSLHFFLTDSNINGLKISAEEIFDHYKIKKLFLKHQTELANIEHWYNQARTLGTLLIIAVPKNMVTDYCYAAIPGGYKNPMAPNITSFLDELATANNKLNNEEFCIIMLDEAMNPEGGILINAYHCAESTAYKQFETSYNSLITQLQKEITQLQKKAAQG